MTLLYLPAKPRDSNTDDYDTN